MKRVLTILAILLLPLSVMAMTPVSDNELADVSGQSGVTIAIGELNLSVQMDTITWGDLDGLIGPSGWDNPYTATITSTPLWRSEDAGFINASFYDLPMHIAISNLQLMFDVGTYANAVAWDGATAVPTQRAIMITIAGLDLQVDAFGFHGIFLDDTAGALKDYEMSLVDGDGYNATIDGYLGDYYMGGGTLNGVYTAGGTRLNTKNLGAFGLSGLKVSIPALKVYIYAH